MAIFYFIFFFFLLFFIFFLFLDLDPGAPYNGEWRVATKSVSHSGGPGMVVQSVDNQVFKWELCNSSFPL